MKVITVSNTPRIILPASHSVSDYQDTKPRSILDGAFNALSLDYSNCIEKLHEKLNWRSSFFPSELIIRCLDFVEGKLGLALSKFSMYVNFLEQVGKEASVCGPNVYYPFGGFDIFYPFCTVKDATDIFSFGKDKFGSASDVIRNIGKILVSKEELTDLLGQYSIYDGSTNGGYYSTHLKSGLGAISVARAIGFLKCRVKGLYYFNLNNDGTIAFFGDELRAKETINNDKNAVIEIYDIESDTKKRFWYFQHNTEVENVAFKNFISSLTFQTLFIKAPYHAWELNRPHRIKEIEETLLPTKRNNARVLTDSAFLDENPHPIWLQDPHNIENALRSYQFGYSARSNHIYFGPSEWLIDPDTPVERILFA